MSLVIRLDMEQVFLENYNLSFPFTPPPEKLTTACLQTCQILRSSSALQKNSSRTEREEVQKLFKHYGEALYKALIPESIREDVKNIGSIVIISADPRIQNLPLELLYDGSSFIAQTHGVLRGFTGARPTSYSQAKKRINNLNAQLFSYRPLIQPHPEAQEPAAHFIGYVEEIPLFQSKAQNKIRFHVNGDASRNNILTALETKPDLFFFSGFDTGHNWQLDGRAPQSTADKLLQNSFFQAATEGLRVLMLHTSSLLKNNEAINHYYNFGVPLLITMNGFFARERIFQYSKEFFHALQNEDNLLKAHRHALNSLQVELAVSWDWAWMQIHIHQDFIDDEHANPIRAFVFQEKDSQDKINQPSVSQLPRKFFNGKLTILQELILNLITAPTKKILQIQSLNGQPTEAYLLEFFRRLKAKHNFYWKTLYYQRWGYHKNEPKNLTTSHFEGKFNQLFAEEEVLSYFEESLITMQEGVERGLQYLSIYYPPEIQDPIFEKWVALKQQEGWQIILISHQQTELTLPVLTINADFLGAEELTRQFEGNLPPIWEDWQDAGLPPQIDNLKLLELLHHCQDVAALQDIAATSSQFEILQAAFDQIYANLSSIGKKVFLILYLVKVKLSYTDLQVLLGKADLKLYITRLQNFELIEANLDQTQFWIPSHLWALIDKNKLLAEGPLLHQGRELLKQLSYLLDDDAAQISKIKSGFSFALSLLFQLGLGEGLIYRNLQFTKKLARFCVKKPSLIYQLLLPSFELSLLYEQKNLREDCLLGTLNILEQLPHPFDQIQLYHWFMQEEHKKKNWPIVSELMTKIAGILAKQGESEQAIVYLTNALSLNNDIQNYADSYPLLTTIAMLFLELDEFEKAEKLVENADFNPELLTPDQMTQLWLVDTHLLSHHQNVKEAKHSLQTLLTRDLRAIPLPLMAKTKLLLADLLEGAQKLSELTSAAHLYETANQPKKALPIHQNLADFYFDEQNISAASSHLEWIFHYHYDTENLVVANQVAHQLGGLFYQIGNKAKSTEYYKIAQGIGV